MNSSWRNGIQKGRERLAEKKKNRTLLSRRFRRNRKLVLLTVVFLLAALFLGQAAAGKIHAAKKRQEPKKKQEAEEKIPYGLKAILEGVAISQDTESELKKVGTSLETVMVGQRVGKKEVESQLDFEGQSGEGVGRLEDSVIGISEGKLKMTEEDYQNLLQIVEAEAGGEDLKGRILVANVIFNRVKHPEFPDTISQVVWEKVAGTPQFSPTADGRISTVTVSEETREAVNRAIDGEDYSQGALFFMQEEASEEHNVKWFQEDLKFLFEYGVHDFYTYP